MNTQLDTLDWPGAAAQKDPVEYKDAVVAMAQSRLAFDAETAIDRFAPVLHFHPNETHFPSSIEWYLERIQLWFDRRFKRDIPVGITGSTSLSTLAHQKCHDIGSAGSEQTPFFMEITHDGDERLVESGDTDSANVYVHVRPALSADSMSDIQYWFFYPLNGWDDRHHRHDGDWEHITVRVTNTPTPEPTAIYFSAHGPGMGSGVTDGLSSMSSAEHHPVVYSALASHASYASPGTYKRGGLRPVDHTADGGQTWDTTNRTKLVALSGQPLVNHDWITYSGRWGESGAWYLPWITHGPVGPAFQASWYQE